MSLRHGDPPTIFDTDHPDGEIIRHFPQTARIVDIEKTTDQVALFDGVLGADSGHFLIDLSSEHMAHFFNVYCDIDFEAGAEDAGIDNTVFYLIDRTVASVENAVSLHNRISRTRFVPVRNRAIGDALDVGRTADLYHSMRFDREILLPELSSETLGMLEHPEFHFDAFVAGRYEHFPFEMKAELWGFLESLYEQRQSVGDGSTFAV